MTLTTPPTPPAAVVAGVDTHSGTHHVAVLNAATGAVLQTRQIPANATGYRQALDFATSLATIGRWGIEGTNSYGAGLTRFLHEQGQSVREVIRPNRAERRLRGKSDPLDAITAARVVLAQGGDLPIPKQGDGPVESVRVLSLTRDSAVKSRANVLRQIAMLLVSAPTAVRENLTKLSESARLATLVASRPGKDPSLGIETATMIALRTLARRHAILTQEITETTAMLRALVEQVNPALIAAKGVGVVTAATLLVTMGDNPERIRNSAAFAMITGTAPIPASSGKTHRTRLNRGGDRRANSAIHTIALARLSCDPTTKAYIAKKKAEGKSTNEALRCLKRHLANELYRLLTNPPTVPDITDLRPARLQRGLSLQTVADHFQVWPMHISTIERGKRRDDDLAHRYRQWLTAA